MGGGKGSKAPKAPKQPDPQVVAEAQTKLNQETARTEAALNRVNEVGPFGSLTYSQLGPDQYQREVTVDPQTLDAIRKQQQLTSGLYDTGQQLLPGLQELLGQPIQTDFSEDRQRVEKALMDRLQPYLDRDRDALENKLINQGIRQEHDAYGKEFDTFNRGVNDARLAAIGQAGQEESRLFNLQNQSRQQGLNEVLQLYGGGQIDVPQFQGAAPVGINPADYQGQVNQNYQAQLQDYYNKLNQQNQTQGQLFGLGGSVLGGFLGGR